MHTKEEKQEAFGRLLDIMDELREKCPWDREQTMLSLRNQTIEECFELTDAIVKEEPLHIKKELGDLLLHIVFYAKIGSEEGHFDMMDVIEALNEKLIYRHPHVFSTTEVENARQVSENWETLKQKEKDGNKTILSGVPNGMPALPKASRIQDKVSTVGFDWEKREDVWEKVKEEIAEVQERIEDKNRDELENEFGDVLFSIVNAARLYGINPDLALERTNQKFINRFTRMEKEIKKKGLDFRSMNLAEMDVYWNAAKKEEK